MEIIKLDFIKTKDNQTDLSNSHNMTLLEKYVLPIIAENPGWGTGGLTRAEFKKNSSKFQEDITNSTWANVHIAMLNNNPVGLLEFEKDLISSGTYQSIPVMREIFAAPSHPLWEKALVESNSTFKPNFNEVKEYLFSMPLYHEIGIVLAPQFQGKGTGASEQLLKIISDGICFGWTSNSVVVRLFRKQFQTCLFYPLYEESIDTVEKFAMHLHIVADISTYEKNQVKPYDYGVISSEYFVHERENKYKDLARLLNKEGKLSDLDLKRILYVLQYKSVQGAIIGIV